VGDELLREEDRDVHVGEVVEVGEGHSGHIVGREHEEGGK